MNPKLKSEFRRRLYRLSSAITLSLEHDCVFPDLFPALFAVFSYSWQRPSHRFHTSEHFVDFYFKGSKDDTK